MRVVNTQRLAYVWLPIYFLSVSEARQSLVDTGMLSTPSLTKENWVTYQLQRLTLEERIGQLFMVAAYSNKDEAHHEFIENLIQQYHIGGLIFFQGEPVKQATLSNRYQKKAQVPLLIAMDAEWGLGMRLQNTISYPRNMALGAVQNHQLIYEMGAEIARQLKLLGVHINLAPVLDINTNPNNPVIGNRAFGDGKGSVTSRGLAYIQGLQNQGIMAVAKHFPGHGDVNQDSHYELPVILHDRTRLMDTELYPFQKAIEAHIGGIMTGHLYVPAYDQKTHTAASLSFQVATELLQRNLGFKGLVFTDALNMKAVNKYYQPGEVDLLALQAGHDILLVPENVPKAISCIKVAIQQGRLTEEAIEQKVKKILAVKYDMNLHLWEPLPVEGLCDQLNAPQAQALKQTLFEHAVTIVANQEDVLPITQLHKHKIASLSIINQPIKDQGKRIGGQQSSVETYAQAFPTGMKTPAMKSDGQKEEKRKIAFDISQPPTVFSQFLSKYAPVDHYTLNRAGLEVSQLQELAKVLENYSLVMVGVYDLNNNRAANFGLQPALLNFLENLQHPHTKVITTVFGNVYSLELMKNMQYLIAAYQDDPIMEQVVPQVIFGALPALGMLPISIPNAWPAEWGIRTKELARLGYAWPESVQMNSQVLKKVDAMVEEAMADEVMPGCQILIARNGKIIFEKAYGYHTYAKKEPVTISTLYDIASITKVVGPLQALMYLVEKKGLDVAKKISYYLPELYATNKKNLTIRSILAHQAGLVDSSIWNKSFLQEDHKVPRRLLRNSPSASYPNRAGTDVYVTHLVKELLWDLHMKAPLKKRNKHRRYDYHYNDASFLIMHRLIEKQLQQPMDVFLATNFYQKLGAHWIGYNPLERFSLQQIAPTAEGDFFRVTPIHGIVHDPRAALCGGVAGHAGLFSNAHNLALVLQMNLQGGYYGGKQYLGKEVIQRFTQQAFKNNRRGLGWDKPALINKKDNKCLPNTSLQASAATYGHLGFTGTCAWVDPTYNLVYVFLSNRTYPMQTVNKLAACNLRTKIQDIVYQALLVSKT
eukprot:gene1043-1324_t